MMGEMKHDAIATLKGAGLRATRQRLTLLAALETASRPHSVEELVRACGNTFDTATAYRMLDAFRDAGLARRIELAQGRALFERAGVHHHHAVCMSCGRIEDVEACVPGDLDRNVKRASGFASIDDHALEFFGTCASCARKKP